MGINGIGQYHIDTASKAYTKQVAQKQILQEEISGKGSNSINFDKIQKQVAERVDQSLKTDGQGRYWMDSGNNLDIYV